MKTKNTNSQDQPSLEVHDDNNSSQQQKEGKICERKENDICASDTEKITDDTLSTAVKKEQDKFLRLFAEFENYKKRTQKERFELFKTANQEILVALIPVLDDFKRGMIEVTTPSSEDTFRRGIELIQDKFFRILEEQGLKEIETKTGDHFNTDLHEAVTQIAAPSGELKGKIITIVECGYNLYGKVIRHAKVIVGK